jgi:hypothetical protein
LNFVSQLNCLFDQRNEIDERLAVRELKLISRDAANGRGKQAGDWTRI